MATKEYILAAQSDHAPEPGYGDSLRMFRKFHIERALRMRNDNLEEAAALLGISAAKLIWWIGALKITAGLVT